MEFLEDCSAKCDEYSIVNEYMNIFRVIKVKSIFIVNQSFSYFDCLTLLVCLTVDTTFIFDILRRWAIQGLIALLFIWA